MNEIHFTKIPLLSFEIIKNRLHQQGIGKASMTYRPFISQVKQDEKLQFN